MAYPYRGPSGGHDQFGAPLVPIGAPMGAPMAPMGGPMRPMGGPMGPMGGPMGNPMGPGGRPYSCPPARSSFGPPPGPPRGFPGPPQGRPAVPMNGIMGGPPLGVPGLIGPGMTPGIAPGMAPDMAPGMAPGMTPIMAPPMGQSLVLASQPPAASRSAMLLSGCYAETSVANAVAMSLDGIRISIAESLQPPILFLMDEIRKCSTGLVQLSESTRSHPGRVPVLLDYLEILLPCFQKSLKDIQTYCDDSAHSKEIRWRTMYHKMMEVTGIPLPNLFANYHGFIMLLGQMLTRNPNFDMNTLEVEQRRLEDIRDRLGLDPPKQSKALTTPSHLGLNHHDKNVHWAEEIFSRPLPSRTPLKHHRYSVCHGPWLPLSMSPNAKILFRRTFDNERLTLLAYIEPSNNAPYLMMRSLDDAGNPIYSTKGVHEVMVEREGSCLVLQRWSFADKRAKLWAFLYFLTWEELVLFQTTFIALKADGILTQNVLDHEFTIGREKSLFQARISDDGYNHLLVVFQDAKSGRIRLHASVWEGEMRYCPVWTSFLTHHEDPKDWIVRKRDPRRIYLKGIHLYVFCNEYREENMRQNRSGYFELNFLRDDAAAHFRRVFDPFPSANTSSAPSTMASGPGTSAGDSDSDSDSDSSVASGTK